MIQNFRKSIGGFNREDVVRYIEYMNTKHAEEIAALNDEMDQLRQMSAPLRIWHTLPNWKQAVPS